MGRMRWGVRGSEGQEEKDEPQPNTMMGNICAGVEWVLVSEIDVYCVCVVAGKSV